MSVLVALLAIPLVPAAPVAAVETTTALSAMPNPAAYLQDVTLTATVTPTDAGTPTGSVEFIEGPTTLGIGVLDGSGVATFTTALLGVGSHSIIARYVGELPYDPSDSSPLLLEITRAAQATLSITGSATKTYGDAPFAPSTSGGSGTGAVTFTSSTPAVCAASASATVTIVAAGTCTVTATKAADADYQAATSVAADIAITRAAQATLSITGPATKTYGDAPFAPDTSGGNGTGATTFTSSTPAVCAASASATVTIVAAGTCSITATKAGDANYEPTTPSAAFDITVNPRTLTVTATGVAKVYDGTTAATVTLAGNTVLTDVVTLGYASASFTTAAVGVGKTVNVSGISITGGADAGNYVVGETTASTTASITTASVTPSATAPDKVYDGTTAAPGTTCSLAGVFPADVGNVTCSGTASFADKNAGTNKTVTLTEITLGGSAAGYYALSATTATDQANITPRPLTVTATGVNKVYDGSAVATVTLGDDRIAGDSLVLAYAGASFDNPNAANSKPVTVVGISVAGGAAAGNYTLANTTDDATAGILAAPTAASVGTSINPVPVTTPVTLTARVTWPGGAPSGSVVFRDGSTQIGGPVALANGTATLITSFATAGNRDITAAYVPDSANFAASTSAVFTQTVGRSSVRLDLVTDRATWETGVPLTLTARLTPAATGVTVALTGSVAFLIDGALVAMVPVVGSAAAHRATLAAGRHAIVATFVPDAAAAIAFDGSESAPLVGSVVANAVAASGVGLSGSTVYPYRDTWRDTVTIGGSRAEPLSVTIRIYRPSGSLLTTRTIAGGSGAYASAWNGRTSGGTILPAGRYRVVQTLTDPSSVPPLVRSWTSYVTLSTRRMAWTTVSLYRNANAPARWSGAPSRLSSSRYRSGARLITPSSVPGGWAAFGYQFTLPSATTIRSVAFFVQGGPWSGPTAPKIGLHDWRAGGDWAAMYDGARTRRPVGTSTSSWYGIAGDPAVVVKSISGRRYVRAFVDTGGYVAGFRYELGRVRLVVTYGVLK